MMPNTRRGYRCLLSPALAVLLLSLGGGALLADAARAQAPEQATPIMPVAEVRIGMKGYGLTVLQGTKIEPFAVEVISVVPNANPKRGVIWIECEHPALTVSGPVQGMSGSPIFLWDEGEEGTIGEGGKLIGAFAFGFSGIKVPLAGVQPIEYMRETGQRAAAIEKDPEAHRRAMARPAGGASGLATLDRLASVAEASGMRSQETFRLTLAREALRRATRTPASESNTPELPQTPDGYDGQAVSLSLPMAVNSPQTAAMLRPLFEGSGIMPVAADNAIAGRPPHGTDPDTPIAPGSVLSIPLAFGDTDLSAAGTATEVLPDGTVIGFGHPMFGRGPTAVPMASGYVHFVAPRITISFKRAGSLNILGSIVRDESAAVAGIGQKLYTTAPVSVRIEQPGLDVQSYQFEVVHDETLTPSLVATVYALSAEAIHSPPARSTLRLSGRMSFEGDRTVELDTTLPTGNVQAAIMEMMPAMTLAAQNPFESLKLTGADFKLTVEDGLQFATIEAARADRRSLHAGDTVTVTVQLREYEGEAFTRRAELTLPADLAPGEYQLHVGDAGQYANRLGQSRPYLFEAQSIDELMAVVRDTMAIERKAFYVMLPTNRKSVSIGRQNLSDLPPSKASLIRRTAGSALTEFSPMIEVQTPMPMVVSGQAVVPITVTPRSQP